MTKNVYYQIAVFCFVLLVALIVFTYFSGNKTEIEQDLKMSSIFGNEVNFLIAKQPYVLHFFASWCKSCAIDHSIVLQYKNTLPIYAVGSLDEPSKIKAYLVKHQNPYLDVIEDTFGNVAKHFKVSALPETILINDNKVIMRIKGPLKQDDLEKKIIPLFRGF